MRHILVKENICVNVDLSLGWKKSWDQVGILVGSRVGSERGTLAIVDASPRGRHTRWWGLLATRGQQ